MTRRTAFRCSWPIEDLDARVQDLIATARHDLERDTDDGGVVPPRHLLDHSTGQWTVSHFDPPSLVYTCDAYPLDQPSPRRAFPFTSQVEAMVRHAQELRGEGAIAPVSHIVKTARRDGALTEHTATRLAHWLGLHPSEVWPDLFWPASIEVAG